MQQQKIFVTTVKETEKLLRYFHPRHIKFSPDIFHLRLQQFFTHFTLEGLATRDIL